MIFMTIKLTFLSITLLCGFLGTTTKIFGMETKQSIVQFINSKNKSLPIELFIKEKDSSSIRVITSDGPAKLGEINDDLITNCKSLNILQKEDESFSLTKRDKTNFGTLRVTKKQLQTIITYQQADAPLYITISNKYYRLRF